MWISIDKNIRGEYVISDSAGNKMRYSGYSKRDSLSKFKKQFGYTGKRGIDVYDET